MFLPPRNSSGEEESDKSESLSTTNSSRGDDADSIFALSLTFDDEGSSKEDRDDTEWHFIPPSAYEGHHNDIALKTFVLKQLTTNIETDSATAELDKDNEEPGTFPIKLLPFSPNHNFYGRRAELEKIYDHLKPTGDESFRIYTIYGRRGIGKTEVALQFAHANAAAYDAMFWVQCDTSVTIRQSFTDIAISLGLPGADGDAHHEENLLAVKTWLKMTKRRWLLIFDNTENSNILRAYWPTQGSSGAILLTSRKYQNLQKDLERRGDTVKPFDIKQSWDFLLQLLGPDWQRAHHEGKLPQSEITAAKSMLEYLEGFPLAIQQAVIFIKDSQLGGPTITKTFELFKQRIRELPERHSSPKSSTERVMDALWDLSFGQLTKNAKVLLGILAWLAPDTIQIDLFLPTVQSILDGPLEFCKQVGKQIDKHPPPQLLSAIEELLARRLIKRDERNLTIHRVVQEAFTYNDSDNIQTSFNAATKLVNSRFPRKETNMSLFSKWSICQEYISHGVNLSRRFADYSRSGVIKGSATLVELLGNCAWYLHELGDYEVSGRVLETALTACEDPKSLLYADLRDTAGTRFFNLNRLSDCHKAWDESLTIRKSLLSYDSPELAAIYHNLGNLELARGNPEDSLLYFNRAILIWKDGGDETAQQLALSYLCVGRVYMLQGKLANALKMTSQSESLFTGTTEINQVVIMASIHYAHGNIHFRQQNLAAALHNYDSCLKISLANIPIHPMTSAAYYSIACVELEQKNTEAAKGWLKKALSIAELRSPNRDDGPIARILWTLAKVLDSEGRHQEEAEELRSRAAVAAQELTFAGAVGVIPVLDNNYSDRDVEKDSYDALVPLFYR
ncbi:P-loop containing nucleoside triphosphate hydrolase protein [Hyaloscypha finlandica]|nr:P-loop containing nucleoside triphosphate hydrolase protein [Hyaloscypha finlandica]